MEDLKLCGALQKIADENPETRKHLIPIIKQAAKKTMKVTELPPKERKIAEKKMAKGYKYICQFTTIDGDLDPMYFKSPNEIGPFRRQYQKDHGTTKIKWTFRLEPAKGKK